MLRVRSSALTVDEQGRLLFGGTIFNGLACRVGVDGIVDALEVAQDGRLTMPSADWLDLPDGGTRIDFSNLEMAGDYGPYLWRGTPITGVVYTFSRQGPCLIEQVYRDGQPDDEARRGWYPSGVLQQLVQGEEGSTWFEDGRLRARGVGETTLLNLIVRDDGSLGGINVGDAALFDIATVVKMPLAKDLFLIGPGIDTALLLTLRDRTAFKGVQCLRLSETLVGPDAVDVLAECAGLNALWLRKNSALSAEDAKRIRALRPDMLVEFVEPDED